jgi:protein phosphatase
VILLCSDGLTKHVTDEQIARRLGHLTSSASACQLLLEDALAGGGSDNVTVVVLRAVAPG